MASMQKYRRDLGWSQRELAKRAHLDLLTIQKAERGELIPASTADALVEALSVAYGKRLLLGDFDDLNTFVAGLDPEHWRR